jgi:endonuclease/exonuclease/phosphatase (EEP) superfamily protein YafD
MPPLPSSLATWRSELGTLRDFAAGVRGGGPTILAGDFNASQDHAAFRRILDTGLHDGARLAGAARAPSWPSRTTPTFGAQIDHVLVSPDFTARDARFLTLAHTDHRALRIDLTLHGQRATDGASTHGAGLPRLPWHADRTVGERPARWGVAAGGGRSW